LFVANFPSFFFMNSRIVIFIISLIYFIVPYSRWIDIVSTRLFSSISAESFGRGLVVFLILGVSLSGLRDRIVPKFLHPILTMVTYIPDSILSHVEGRGKFGNQHFVFNMIQLSILIMVLKILVKFLIVNLVSVVVVVLFKSTLFTYTLVMKIANFGLEYPLAILVLLPLIKRISWYYLLVYFSICGASCAAASLGIAGALMLVWRHLVVQDLFTSSSKRPR